MPLTKTDNCLIIKFWIEVSGLKSDLRKALEESVATTESDLLSDVLDKQAKNTFYTDFDKKDWRERLGDPSDCPSVQVLTKNILNYEFNGKYLYLQLDTSKDRATEIGCYVSILHTFWGWFGEYIEMKLYKNSLLPQVMFNVEDQIIAGTLEENIPFEEWNCKRLKRTNVEYYDV